MIQPLLVTTIVFALPLGYFLTSQVDQPAERSLGAAVVVLGLAIFTVVGKAGDGNDNAPAREWAARRPRVRRRSPQCCSFWADRGSLARKAGLYGACAGVLYGLSASLCKPTVEILGDDGFGAVLTSWEFYAFAIAGILAFVVQQVSLATGKLAASVATVSVCNPLVSIVIGTLLLDERLAQPPWHKVVAYCGLGVALFGAVVDLDRDREERRRRTRVDAERLPAAA